MIPVLTPSMYKSCPPINAICNPDDNISVKPEIGESSHNGGGGGWPYWIRIPSPHSSNASRRRISSSVNDLSSGNNISQDRNAFDDWTRPSRKVSRTSFVMREGLVSTLPLKSIRKCLRWGHNSVEVLSCDPRHVRMASSTVERICSGFCLRAVSEIAYMCTWYHMLLALDIIDLVTDHNRLPVC